MAAPNLVTEAAVESAYRESGNALGWRLLSSPASTLRGAEVALLGLNPGGQIDRADHPRFAVSHGSAYVEERWHNFPPGRNPLQTQVRALFDKLRVKPERVLAGNLVPFRSPNWKALKNKRFALEFGRRLWTEILKRARPRLVIGMGREVTHNLRAILGAGPSKRHRVGWGCVTGTCATFQGGLLVGLPHLSRFTIVTRPASQSGLQSLFGKHWHA